MNNELIAKITDEPSIKYIFCDYYDTIIHRKVHPLEPFRIWAKSLKEDFNLKLSINSIYKIRRASINHVSRKIEKVETEIGYELIMREIYHRINSLKAIDTQIVPFVSFLERSYEADYESEAGVQYLNMDVIKALRCLKNQGYIIYCVSDFYSDEAFIERLMENHGVLDLYEKIFVSASQNASKENSGLLYVKIMEEHNIEPNQVLMVGDNYTSDYVNAKLQGMEAFHLKSLSNKLKQKAQFIMLMTRNVFYS